MTVTAERPTIQEGVHIPGLDIVLPPELDLTKDLGRELVVQAVTRLTHIYASRCPGFVGTIVFGSIAHKDSHNGSDVDLLYVIDPTETQRDYDDLMQDVRNLDNDIEQLLLCYGIRLGRNTGPRSKEKFTAHNIRMFSMVFDLYKKYPDTAIEILQNCCLDKHLVPIFPDKETKNMFVAMRSWERFDRFFKKEKHRSKPDTAPKVLDFKQAKACQEIIPT